MIRPVALNVLACVYGGISSLRATLYAKKLLPSYRSSLPVVSVGNVTVGGNGKTPLCLYLVAQLRERGFQPVVLSRGYGGRVRGPHVVTPGDSPSDVGDEPLLIAQTTGVPVVVSRRRAEGAKLIERQKIGNVILLDDGLQHRALARSLDIASVFVGHPDAVTAFLEGKLLPAGRFREDRDTALARCSIVVLAERSAYPSSAALPPVDPRILSVIPPSVKIYRSYLEPRGLRSLEGAEGPAGGDVVAFAGLANPEGFFSSLERLGYRLAAKRTFADHHPFNSTDLDKLRSEFKGIPLVCTEKDAVKIRALKLGASSGCFVLDGTLKVTPSDAFMVQIVRSLRPSSTEH